jgi:primosomal protein N'
MTTAEYIQSINQMYKSGNATEHTYRPALQEIIQSLVPTVNATNEPKRQQGIAPDYIITKKQKLQKENQTLITVGYIEAKDIGDNDLLGKNKNGNKEQFDKYKELLFSAPLMFTDYLTFHIFRQGKLEASISIAEVTSNGIKPVTNNFEQFENLMKDFCTLVGQTIRSSKELAKMMAEKARLLSYQIEKSLLSDEGNREDSTLKDQMLGFKKVLMHTITEKEFADVYAQTIAYGMFTARLHDPTLPTFSRQEAAELIPKSNPFLRKLFGYIAGPDLDDRIKWIVDSLIEIFLASNVEQLLKDYGKKTKMEDPIIHFLKIS